MSFGSGKRANPLMRLITYLGTQPAHMGVLPSVPIQRNLAEYQGWGVHRT
ncbi:hypothetical protein FHR92_004447 [Fontibacillus solani]|uniref:Uncharacterized protein n=1 Tax=Fontibacillus solani TaxID=1572857 RepID=A0A7W3SXA9_9BACL|nr:hypothetical protein [Fontibacillus solani]